MLPAWTKRPGQGLLPAITPCWPHNPLASHARPPQWGTNAAFLLVATGIELILTAGLLPELAKGPAGDKAARLGCSPGGYTGHHDANRGSPCSTKLTHTGHWANKGLRHCSIGISNSPCVMQCFPGINLHYQLAHMIFFFSLNGAKAAVLIRQGKAHVSCRFVSKVRKRSQHCSPHHEYEHKRAL